MTIQSFPCGLAYSKKVGSGIWWRDFECTKPLPKPEKPEKVCDCCGCAVLFHSKEKSVTMFDCGHTVIRGTVTSHCRYVFAHLAHAHKDKANLAKYLPEWLVSYVLNRPDFEHPCTCCHAKPTGYKAATRNKVKGILVWYPCGLEVHQLTDDPSKEWIETKPCTAPKA